MVIVKKMLNILKKEGRKDEASKQNGKIPF